MTLRARVAALLLGAAAAAAHADAVDTLRGFVRDVKTGRADFTQTVTSPDGVKKKVSSGRFEFARPNRFRFEYLKPYDQLIVGDGQKVWIHDADLNQASSRRLDQELGSTPAALLAGGALERDFDLAALPDRDGLAWAEARPKAKEGAFQSLRVGFRGAALAAVEVVDGFGQKSLLQFSGWEANARIDAARFVFVPPPGADVVEQ